MYRRFWTTFKNCREELQRGVFGVKPGRATLPSLPPQADANLPDDECSGLAQAEGPPYNS